MQKEFLFLLNSLNEKLQPIFSTYLKEEQISKIIKTKADKKAEILKIVEDNNVVLISANSAKRKLKNIGIDPRQFIVTGGPLSIEDYMHLNPNLSEKVRQGIKIKCEKLNNQLLKENWGNKDLIFIYESENPTDKLILNKLEDITKLIKKKPILIELKSWNDLGK